MATTYHKFKGLVSYAQVYRPDEFPAGTLNWKLNLHPDADTILKIKETGCQARLKADNEEYSGVPGKFFQFKRPTKKQFGNKTQIFTPPGIYDKDGKPLVTYEVVNDEVIKTGEGPLIGNGSEIEVEVEIYDTRAYGKGTRLLNVRILDLIEYTPPEDMTDNEVDNDEAPFDVDTKKPAAKTTSKRSSKVSW